MSGLKGKIRFFAAGFMMLLSASFMQSGMVRGEETARTVDEDHVKVYVAGILVTDANKDDVLGDETGSVKYDPTTRTLSLNNATIPVTEYQYVLKGGGKYWTDSGILFFTENTDANYEANRITIDLTGENRIETKTPVGETRDGVHGIVEYYCPITLEGEGSLTIDLGFKEGFSSYIRGITNVYADLIIGDGVSLKTEIDAPFDPQPNVDWAVDGLYVYGMDLQGGKLEVDIQSHGAGTSGIASKHDIRITDQAVVDVNISSPQYQEGDPVAKELCGIGRSEAQALFIEDSTVTVQVGGSEPAARDIYGICAPVSVKGNSRLKVSAGNVKKTAAGDESYGIYTCSQIKNDHPLGGKLFMVGGNAVVEVSACDYSISYGSSLSSQDTFPTFSDYTLGEYGKARVSENRSGTPYSVWEQKTYGPKLSAYKYARFPAYLPDEFLKGTFETGGRDDILKKKEFSFCEGMSATDLADRIIECIDDNKYEVTSDEYDKYLTGKNKKTGAADLLLGFDEGYSDMQTYKNSFKDRVFTENVKVYLFWLSPITEVSVEVSSPAEGEQPEGYAKGITASAIGGSGTSVGPVEGLAVYGGWVDYLTGERVEEPFEAGKKYPLFIGIMPGFGYYFPNTDNAFTGRLDLKGADCRFSFADDRDGIMMQLDVMCISEEMEKAQAFMSLADALPEAENILLTDEEAVKALRKQYESLSKEEKAFVKKESLQRLLDAEAAIAKLKSEKDSEKETGQSSQKEQKPSETQKEQKQEKAGKSANPIKVSGRKISVKAEKLKKSAVSFAGTKIVTITDAKGKISYSLKGVKKAKYKKYFSINKKTGKLKIKKKLKKGTYTLNILVTAEGDDTYEKGEAFAKVIVKVK